MRGVVQEALSTTRAWLAGTFKQSMFNSSYTTYVRFTYSQEIQVSRRPSTGPQRVSVSWRTSGGVSVSWGTFAGCLRPGGPRGVAVRARALGPTPQRDRQGQALVRPPAGAPQGQTLWGGALGRGWGHGCDSVLRLRVKFMALDVEEKGERRPAGREAGQGIGVRET